MPTLSFYDLAIWSSQHTHTPQPFLSFLIKTRLCKLQSVRSFHPSVHPSILYTTCKWKLPTLSLHHMSADCRRRPGAPPPRTHTPEMGLGTPDPRGLRWRSEQLSPRQFCKWDIPRDQELLEYLKPHLVPTNTIRFKVTVIWISQMPNLYLHDLSAVTWLAD